VPRVSGPARVCTRVRVPLRVGARLLVSLSEAWRAVGHAASWLYGSRVPPWRQPRQAGYSSVGRASDCTLLQLSDEPWFDFGWPDLDIDVRSVRPDLTEALVRCGVSAYGGRGGGVGGGGGGGGVGERGVA
jgi:hypothetical protein